MKRVVSASRAALASVLLTGFSLTVAVAAMGSPNAQSTYAMSCFVIAGNMSCIDGAGVVPIVPTLPPITVPAGSNVDGENETYVVKDDGGYEVARG
jgi:hypothetical protein